MPDESTDFNGFDSVPEISTEQAFGEEFDSGLIEVGDILDNVLENITGVADDEIRNSRIELIRSQNAIGEFQENELEKSEQQLNQVIASLSQTANRELVSVGEQLAKVTEDNTTNVATFSGCGFNFPLAEYPDLQPWTPNEIPPNTQRYYGSDFSGLDIIVTAPATLQDVFHPAFPGALWGVGRFKAIPNDLHPYFLRPSFNGATIEIYECPVVIPEPPIEEPPIGEEPPIEPEPPIKPEPPKPKASGECDDPLFVKICVDEPTSVYLDCEAKILVVAKENDAKEEWVKISECSPGGEFDLDTLLKQCEETTTNEEGLPFVPKVVDLFGELKDGCVLPKIPKDDKGIRDAVDFALNSALFGGLPVAIIDILKGFLKGDTGWSKLLVIGGFLVKNALKISDAAWAETCNGDKTVQDRVLVRAIMLFLDRFVPGAFGEQVARMTQSINERCPALIPTMEQAFAAYHTQYIDLRTFDCWVRANGYDSKIMEPVRQATESRIGINEATEAFRRELINADDYNKYVRRNGFQDGQSADVIYKLYEKLPNLSDIITFMVRDADDMKVVNRFGLDDEFNNKYGGQLKDWSRQQGVPELVAKYAWRSHWTIPSPTQLYEIFHRVGRTPTGQPIPQIEEDVKQALIQQDILPFWIPKLLATSYTLPTRVDVRRAFRVGVFTENDVLESYVRLGYETKTAQALTKFTVVENNRSVLSSPFVKAFARGEINRFELQETLIKAGATDDATNLAVERGQLLLKVNRRKKCLAAVRHKVLIGEVDRLAAVAETWGITSDREQSNELVETWFCERASKSKTSTASQLCSFFTDGIIDSSEFLQRLVAIGYTIESANELVTRCVKTLQRKILKQENAKRKQLESELKRQAKETERQGRDVVKKQEQTDKARVANQTARERRQKVLLESAKLLAPKVGQPIQDTFKHMKAVLNRFVRNGIASANKIADDGKILAGTTEVQTLADWEDTLLDVLVSGLPD